MCSSDLDVKNSTVTQKLDLQINLSNKEESKKWLIALFAVIMVGIWWTAVYSGHHYLIDVMLGISCALLGIFVFEKGLMKWGAFGRFFERYSRYIK